MAAITQSSADLKVDEGTGAQLAEHTAVELHIAKAIRARHSTRAFKPDPVPIDILEQCLAGAQQAPSSSNLQPWRLTVVYDAAIKRLSQALLAAIDDPDTVFKMNPIPESYRYHRSDLGHQLYGAEGYNIPRSEKAQKKEAENRNYKFFDAPMALILAVDYEMGYVDSLSAGLYLQTLCMLLQEQGIGNCIEVSVARMPEVIRKELGIGENMRILCGIAVGYEDEDNKLNHIRAARDAWRDVVTFIKE